MIKRSGIPFIRKIMRRIRRLTCDLGARAVLICDNRAGFPAHLDRTMRRLTLTLCGLCGAILAFGAGSAAAADPIGEWLVADGSARIGIDNCNGALWGVVTWEKEPGVDSKNPDRSKRNLPTLHLPVLLAMTPAQEDRWDGKVYNAENGKTYTAHLTTTGPDQLRIEGCVFAGYLCGGETWQRVAPADATSTNPVPPAAAPRTGAAKPPVRKSSAPRQLAPPAAIQPVSEVCAAVTERAGPPH